MQTEKKLTDAEKARLMHNMYQREWAKRNKEKVKASQIKCLAKAYDRMMAEQAKAESAGAVDE